MNFKFAFLTCPLLLLALTLGVQAQTKLAIVNMNGADRHQGWPESRV
jgi:hypothetical protein